MTKIIYEDEMQRGYNKELDKWYIVEMDDFDFDAVDFNTEAYNYYVAYKELLTLFDVYRDTKTTIHEDYNMIFSSEQLENDFILEYSMGIFEEYLGFISENKESLYKLLPKHCLTVDNINNK